MVRSDSVILFDIYSIYITDFHLGIHFWVIVSNKEFDKLVFFDFFALNSDTLEARLDRRETFEISLLHRFGFAALFTDGDDGLFGGDG